MKPRLAEALALAAIVCVATVVRLDLAGRHGLWADEVFSLALATGHSLEHPAASADPALGDYVEPPGVVRATAFQRYLEHDTPPAGLRRVIRAVRLSDTNPPIYYLLLHAWTRALGTGDLALRGFSLIWAIATFPVMTYLARRTGGAPAILPAWALFAAAPASLYYSVEGRMYSLLWFLAAAMAAATVHLSRRSSGRGPLALWLGVGAIGLLTHYFFIFVWAACSAWLAVAIDHRDRWRLAAAIGAVIAIISPWYVQIPATLAQWRVTAHWLKGFPGVRHALRAPFDLAWSLVSGHVAWMVGRRWVGLVGLVLVALAFCMWKKLGARTFSGPRSLLWVWLLAAVLGPVVFDAVLDTRASLFPRYALPALPAVLVLASLALSRLKPLARFAMLFLLVLAWAPGALTAREHPPWRAHPTRQIGDFLAGLDVGADVALVHSIPSGVVGVARYAPQHTPMASWVGQLGQRRVPEDIVAIATARQRVVLVKMHAVGAPAPEEVWLREHAAVLSETMMGRAQVVTFRPLDRGASR